MTSPVWKKLNLKDEKQIAVLNAPESLEAEINGLVGVRVVRDVASISGLTFMLAFVTQRKEIEKVSNALTNMADGDITVWFSYPKGSSKRYKCDFNRDSGWEPLGDAGFEGVRQVAIDEDWSALRFRRIAYIKKMKRDPKRALTKKGKAKSLKQ